MRHVSPPPHALVHHDRGATDPKSNITERSAQDMAPEGHGAEASGVGLEVLDGAHVVDTAGFVSMDTEADAETDADAVADVDADEVAV